MADLNEPLARGRKHQAARRRGNSIPPRAALPEAKLLAFAELLFFAYRDFTRDADLLDALNITKQSLSRVLKQLIDKDYIVQRAGASDRRERLLYPTDKGRALASRLAAPQLVRLASAIQAAGPGGEAAIRRFL